MGLRGGTNLYSYVGNNPVKHTDPEGKFIFLLLAPAGYTAVMALADLAIIGGTWWVTQRALQSGAEREFDPCHVFHARRRGRDPELIEVPPWEDLGPLKGAPSLPYPGANIGSPDPNLPPPPKPPRPPKTLWERIKFFVEEGVKRIPWIWGPPA